MVERRGATNIVRLIADGSTWVLPPGHYTLGRAAQCEIRIDSPRVSRQHAEIVVTDSHVTLRDLSSVNGVFVDGVRIDQSRELASGDRFVIGELELEVEIAGQAEVPMPETIPPTRRGSMPPIQVRRPSGAIPAVPPKVDEHGPRDATSKVNALALLGEVAERALATGHADHAEHLLRLRLDELLRNARSGSSIGADNAEHAGRLALKLAAGTRKSIWIRYVFDLYGAERAALPAGVIAAMREAWRVAPQDSDALRTYAELVQQLPSSLDKMATVQLLKELQASGKR